MTKEYIFSHLLIYLKNYDVQRLNPNDKKVLKSKILRYENLIRMYTTATEYVLISLRIYFRTGILYHFKRIQR